MRWRLVAVSTLLLAVGTACPPDWEKGGTIDQAIERDLNEQLNPPACPEGKTLRVDPGCKKSQSHDCPLVCL